MNDALAAERDALAAELADAKADHLRRHNDAVDRYEEIIVLKARVQALEAALREIADKADDPRHVAYEEACIARNALKPTT